MLHFIQKHRLSLSTLSGLGIFGLETRFCRCPLRALQGPSGASLVLGATSACLSRESDSYAISKFENSTAQTRSCDERARTRVAGLVPD